MAKYPSPCEKCERKDNCTRFRRCDAWLTRYRYRQKQINGFAKKVLPDNKKPVEAVAVSQSPCESCNRVKDPENCGSLSCVVWRKWYLEQWGKFNAYAKKAGL